MKMPLIILFIVLCTLGETCFAQGAKFEKQVVANEATFSANADSVWVYLSDLGNLENLVPSTIKKSTLVGEGLGSVVTLDLQNGGKIVEKVVKFNSKKRLISYTMMETPLPIRNYLAYFKVKQIGTNKVKVVFEAQYEVQPENKKARLEAFQNLQKELLANIQKLKGYE